MRDAYSVMFVLFQFLSFIRLNICSNLYADVIKVKLVDTFPHVFDCTLVAVGTTFSIQSLFMSFFVICCMCRLVPLVILGVDMSA